MRLTNATALSNLPPKPPKEFSSEDLDYLSTLVAEKISGEVGDRLAHQGDFIDRVAQRVAQLSAGTRRTTSTKPKTEDV